MIYFLSLKTMLLGCLGEIKGLLVLLFWIIFLLLQPASEEEELRRVVEKRGRQLFSNKSCD